jgi:NAD+ diphosphatase
MAFVGLRKLFGRLDDDVFGTAMRTVQIVAWDRDNQFCGRCGNSMEVREYERAKFCPSCGLTRYPRISPAIIVAVVKDGNKLMMARNHRYPAGWYSVLAGFVEPGETLEDTVAREVREEVGIEVSDISYFGSQPWPFPDSLMVAFTAAYAGGDIVIEEEELEDARWFTLAQMPDLIPSKMSISRRLIDWFIESQQ